MTFRDAGENEEVAGTPVTCDGCGHSFLRAVTTFTADEGDDAFRIVLPELGPTTCPQCGAEVG